VKIVILNLSGKKVGEKDIPASLQAERVNDHLIWEVVKAEQANARQGTHKVKTRGEVRGGGAKPWRQKGTGRARAGTIRAAQWRGGGVVFGPRPRDYREHMPRKKKANGLKHIIISKLKQNRAVLLENFTFSEISTKNVHSALAKVLQKSPFWKEYIKDQKTTDNSNKNYRSITVIVDHNDTNVKKSVANIPWVRLIHSDRLAAIPLFYNHALLMTSSAFDKIGKRYS